MTLVSYEIGTGTILLRVSRAESMESNVVASDSICVIVPLSLTQEFVAEVSLFEKELVANNVFCFPAPSSGGDLGIEGACVSPSFTTVTPVNRLHPSIL